MRNAFYIILALALISCDGKDGGSDSPPPPAPTADAGPDRLTRPGFPVELDGSASRPASGGDLTFSWNLSSAPEAGGGSFSAPSSAVTLFTPLAEGNYLATLTVAENGGTLLRTDRHGDIVLESDGENLRILEGGSPND